MRMNDSFTRSVNWLDFHFPDFKPESVEVVSTKGYFILLNYNNNCEFISQFGFFFLTELAA